MRGMKCKTRYGNRHAASFDGVFEDAVLALPPGWAAHPGPAVCDDAFYQEQAASRRCLNSAVRRFRAARRSRAGCAQARSKKPRGRSENEFIRFGAAPRLFLCPEALFAFLKLQAHFVCSFTQAGRRDGQGRSPCRGIIRAAEALIATSRGRASGHQP